MKKSLLILFLLYSFCASAQNYQCLQPGVKRYFTNANGYLRGMRIDSVRTAGGDITYYPFHTPRGRYYGSGITYPCILDKNGGSWLGKKVIHKNDGTFLFDNIWHDTIVIKTQAHVGDSWALYNDTTKRFYRALLAAEDTMTVLGIIDSVKIINIMVYDDTGHVLTDSINNYQIILSKNNGFVKIFDLHTFPYHAPDSVYAGGFDYYLDILDGNYMLPFSVDYLPSTGRSLFTLIDVINPTWPQLYDHAPGDVFEYLHYSYSIYPYQYLFDSLISKVSTPDSVSYTYYRKRATQHYFFPTYNPNTFYPYDTFSYSYVKTWYNYPLIDTALMPEEYRMHYSVFYFPGDTGFCMNSHAYKFEEIDVSDSLWSFLHFERSGRQWTYKIGLGMANYFDYDAGRDARYDTILQYYKMGSNYCGRYIVPVPSAVTSVNLMQAGYSVYPNPASTLLTIAGAAKITTLTITNLLGQTIYTHDHNTEKVKLDVSHFPPGIYLIKINNSEIRKFVKNP